MGRGVRMTGVVRGTETVSQGFEVILRIKRLRRSLSGAHDGPEIPPSQNRENRRPTGLSLNPSPPGGFRLSIDENFSESFFKFLN